MLYFFGWLLLLSRVSSLCYIWLDSFAFNFTIMGGICFCFYFRAGGVSLKVHVVVQRISGLLLRAT